MIKIRNENGREFVVKIVKFGERYGRDKCLVNDRVGGHRGEEGASLVEFYDATYAGDDRFGAEGQFVTRYYASTLLRFIPLLPDSEFVARGLCLNGEVEAWNVDAPAMQVVEAFVRWNQ